MTKEEDIEIILHCLGVYAEHEVCEECPVYNEGDIACGEAARTAIETLKEFKMYKEIGTVEECREAVEKRKPVRPHRNYEKFSGLWCECGWYLGHGIRLDINYCPNCGHAIQWDLGIRGNGR